MEKKDAAINLEQVNDTFIKSRNKAEKLIHDKQKTNDVLEQAIMKADSVQGPLEKVWNNLQLMFGIVKDWITGNYKEVPVGSIIAIIAALLYFISPIDVIPDFIPIVGYIDDVFVISLVIAQVMSDLEQYNAWKQQKCLNT